MPLLVVEAFSNLVPVIQDRRGHWEPGDRPMSAIEASPMPSHKVGCHSQQPRP